MASETQGTVQEAINAFWKANLGSTQPPSQAFSILPDNVYAKLERQNARKGPAQGVSVAASYVEAVKDCEAKVATIVAECRRNNVKYSDPHFNLDMQRYCLYPLTATPKTKPGQGDEDNTGQNDGDNESEVSCVCPPNITPGPACAKRVGAIFEKPEFFIGGPPNARDTRQGAEGDCWFISAIGSLCVDEEDPHLIERLCPPKARNDKVGVYGFVFYRDGEWFSEIIDDKLYLSTPDYDDCVDSRREAWDHSRSKIDPAEKRKGFRKAFQTGSDALYYGSCADENETWVPLLEKAFAKAHGDYQAISGGWPGEGLEDLTGGVTTMIISDDILDLDELWTEGLMDVNKTFLFSCATREYRSKDRDRQGIQDSHAYSILRAVEYKGERLLLIKNPWGASEWNGPWSDGSKQWTADALRELDHHFGDDGIFWMNYQDFLDRFVEIWRTRLFTANWKVTQKWTTVQVPWAGDYNPTKFRFSLSEPTRTIVVLSKLDTRYFKGLTGQYWFDIAFRLHGKGEEPHIIRGYSSGDRSASAELDLEAGEYDVLMQISAIRDRSLPEIDDVVSQNWLVCRNKLLQIGLSYDLAQAKGQLELEPTPAVNSKAEDKTASTSSKTPDEPVVATPPTQVAETSTNATSETAPQESGGVGTELSEEPSPPTPAPKPDPTPDPTPDPKPDPNPAPPVDDTKKEVPAGDAQADSGVWNATLVVGLRVFCEKGSAVIKTITPSSEEAVQKAKEKVLLDVDDPEKDLAEHFSKKVSLEEETVDDDM